MVSEPFPEVFFMIFGMKKGGKIIKNPDKMRSGNEKAIFRGTCYFVGASTKTEIRGRRKSVRNPEKNGHGTTSETEARSGSDSAWFWSKNGGKIAPKR